MQWGSDAIAEQLSRLNCVTSRSFLDLPWRLWMPKRWLWIDWIHTATDHAALLEALYQIR